MTRSRGSTSIAPDQLGAAMGLACDTRGTDWVQTYRGGAFWPLAPRPEDVRVEDVAHHLSMRCRYHGATVRFYSVAQHAVLLSRAVPRRLAWAALHHDDAEAYLPDVPAPLKPGLPGFKEAERRVEEAVFAALGVSPAEAREVKPWDARIVADEKVLLLPSERPWSVRPEPLGIAVRPWTPARAEREFLARHAALSARRAA